MKDKYTHSNSTPSASLYDINLTSTAINFSETIGEIYDELDDGEFDELLLEALETVGHKSLDISKLKDSISYYYTDDQDALDKIYNSEGYSIEFPEM